MMIMMMHGTHNTRGNIVRGCIRSHDLHLCIIHHKKKLLTNKALALAGLVVGPHTSWRDMKGKQRPCQNHQSLPL